LPRQRWRWQISPPSCWCRFHFASELMTEPASTASFLEHCLEPAARCVRSVGLDFVGTHTWQEAVEGVEYIECCNNVMCVCVVWGGEGGSGKVEAVNPRTTFPLTHLPLRSHSQGRRRAKCRCSQTRRRRAAVGIHLRGEFLCAEPQYRHRSCQPKRGRWPCCSHRSCCYRGGRASASMAERSSGQQQRRPSFHSQTAQEDPSRMCAKMKSEGVT
jgi:hypothetical protein